MEEGSGSRALPFKMRRLRKFLLVPVLLSLVVLLVLGYSPCRHTLILLPSAPSRTFSVSPTARAVTEAYSFAASHVNSSSSSSSTSLSSAASVGPLSSSPSPLPMPPPVALPHLEPSRVPAGCNIFRGDWVGYPDAPRYTNETCPYIQDHQNCMKYGRPDTQFLKWRWRPDGCELPLFDPSVFLSVVRDKSMAFVGDSLARNHMQSLLCLLSQVEQPHEVAPDGSRDERMVLWRFPLSNFTISIFWSPFLINSHKLDRDGYSWNLYLDEPDDAWAATISVFDYVIISAANWFTRPATFHVRRRRVGCHYCHKRSINKNGLYYSHKAALRTALRFILRHEDFHGTVILRTVSPSHFEGGEWNKGGDCRRTGPSGRHESWLRGVDDEFYRTQINEFRKEAKALAASGGGRGGDGRRRLVLMDATAPLSMRPDGHPSRYGHWPSQRVVLYNDCVHWCLPGPIDVLNDMLLQLLLL